MWREYALRHFPTLLGRLPRMVVSLSSILVAAVRRSIWELWLTIPFVGLFIAVLMGTWETFFLAQAVFAAGIVLPLSYLVLLLMVRQHRDRHL